MEEIMVKAIKLGGSLVVTIPKAVVKEEGIAEGTVFKIKVIKKIKKDYFGALKGIGPFTKEDEFDEHK
jgi:hypothetical protein